MSISEFKLLYLTGFGLMVAGALLIGIPEIIAAWFNKQEGDTITEIVLNLGWPYLFWFMGIGSVILFLAWFLFWHLPTQGRL